MRGFKSAATKRINVLRSMPGVSVWQRNYYEHIIRGEDDMNRIREYIIGNPLRWQLDRENSQRRGQDSFDVWLDSFKTRPNVKLGGGTAKT